MPKQRVRKAWKRLKQTLVGDNPWTGPGAVRAATAAKPIADNSFFHAGGRAAVLLIHGLTGTPTEMRFVGKGLAAAGFTVYGMQLAGHCGTEDDLLRTTWHDWYASVEAAYDFLKAQTDTVFVAGLSMGAVMALHLAAQKPGQIAGLGLYSTTLWYDGWAIPKLDFLLPLVLATPMGERFRFVEAFPYGIKDDRLRQRVVANMMSGKSEDAGTLGMAGSSLKQLRRFIAVVKGEIPAVTTPALILHAAEDDVTSLRNANFLEQKLAGPTRKIILDNCYHIITVDQQRNDVIRHSVEYFGAIAGADALVRRNTAAAE